MFLDIMLPPGAAKSFRFSYMYPLDHRGINFVRPSTQGYQSIHIISNKAQIKLAKDDATEIAIPASLGTKFSKAFELNLNKSSIDVTIGGVIPIKYQMRLWTLYFSLLLAMALLLYFFIKPSQREEVTAQVLQEKIKALKASTNPSAQTQHQIDLLQRQLYHILYD
ncbi:MAG: hypothetical protein R3A45_05880 [Bdellovibrionota bacterium]